MKNKNENYDIVTKGVAFNILDPDQAVLLEHAKKRKNFSSYIKRLIQRDMDGTYVPRRIDNQVSNIQEDAGEDLFDSDLMNSLI